MLPRLLALDLDGTLLPRSKTLTPRAHRAVRAVRDAGVTVVLASGKTLHLTEAYARELGLDGPVVALDGGLVRDGAEGDLLVRVAVPAGTAAEVLDRLSGLALSPFLADGADRLLIHEALADWESFLGVYATRTLLSPRPLADAEGDPFFVSLIGSPEEVGRGEAALAPWAANGLSVFSARFLDRDIAILVVRPKTDKGQALARVTAHLGVEREAVTAIGDWKNDTAMIRWAGTGVAMPRSAPETTAVADLVLPLGSEEDGVAAYLEELLLVLA